MVEKLKTYVFGDFRFVPTESLLLKQDEAVALPPKALNLLEKLVENAGSVVTKDDLLRDVWDDLAIEESAVSRTVFLVRAALGDDPKNHTFIQTVPKRGYRFVADVSTLNGSDGHAVLSDPIAQVELEPDADVAGRQRRFSALHFASVFVLVAGAVVAGIYVGFFRNVSAANKPSLLIMPFSTAGDRGGDELLEDGIADALIHHLASSRDLTIRPLSATRIYAGTASDPVQAGREQKASKVLSATYQRADGKLRILARLIDVETGTTDEPFKVETGETGVFAIQDAIASDLGTKIAKKLGVATENGRIGGTTNEEAYRHYLQGMALYDKRNGAKAVESFDRAIDLDPNFARAWTGKATALGAMPSLGNSTSSDLFEKTVDAADRALSLDPGSAEAFSALCSAKLSYALDFAGAEQACAKAMELNPRSPIVLQNYSFLRVSQGRLDEGIEAIKMALDIEPLSFLSQTQYTHILYFNRRHDEAHSQFVRLSELQPDRFPTYEWMIRNLEAGGRESEGMEWLIKSLRLRKADEEHIGRIQKAYNEAGWPGVLRERIAIDNGRTNAFRKAGMYARLGNKDAAFQLLEKAYEARSPIFVTLKLEPQFDPLRDDPRFAELVKRMESGSH